MSPEEEQADLLLGKSREDRAALAALAASPGLADAPIGFHAQQAVEKALTAVLAGRGVDFPWTHDLQLLMRRLEQAGLDLPSAVREARRLGPWAIEYRYGDVLDDSLDRPAALALVDEVIDWAERETTRSSDA